MGLSWNISADTSGNRFLFIIIRKSDLDFHNYTYFDPDNIERYLAYASLSSSQLDDCFDTLDTRAVDSQVHIRLIRHPYDIKTVYSTIHVTMDTSAYLSFVSEGYTYAYPLAKL